MWQAVQVGIAGICGVMLGIFLLYLTIEVSGLLTAQIEKKSKEEQKK